MKKLAISALGCVFACLLSVAPALGQTQDAGININGTTYGTPNPGGPAAAFAAPGVNASGYNQSTGLGTITITINGSSCTKCNADVWLFAPAGTPDFNEYGAMTGTASSGQSWQIDIPDYDSDGNITGTIIANNAANTLSDTNNVPGTTDNFSNDCGANGGGAANANCNDLVSMAIGFSFGSPGSGNQEVLTFTTSLTGCVSGSICLEDIHPPDGNADNQPNGETIFFSATAASGTACTGPSCVSTVPEPSTWLTLGTSLVGLFGFRKRFR